MIKTTRIEMTKDCVIDLLLTAISCIKLSEIDDPCTHVAGLIGKSRRTIDACIAPSESHNLARRPALHMQRGHTEIYDGASTIGNDI